MWRPKFVIMATMTPLKIRTSLFLTLLTFNALALEAYQGKDYPVETWRCGAPLVQALREDDPESLLKDETGKLNLKKSLEEISESNLRRLRSKLGKLSDKESKIIELISTKFHPPIVHRTAVDTSKFILANTTGLISATKRKAPAKVTPGVEEQLFSGYDCIFTSVGVNYGIEDYGNVLVRFKNKKGFAWGSMYTGLRWAHELEGSTVATPEMKRRFSKQIYTNNHWDEALGLFIIENVRAGTTFRGKGNPYDKATILDQLIDSKTPTKFWGAVVYHRLAFLEGHYNDIVPVEDMSFIQYRLLDKPTIDAWKLPANWFKGSDSFIQFFDRAL